MKKTLSILMLALTVNAFAQIPSSGLIASYPFNGNANDASGNGHNGTVTGATLTTDRFGNANSAYSFNGTTDYITVGTFSLSVFTISSWIYTNAVNPTNLNGIISNLASTPFQGVEVRVQPDSTIMVVTGNGSMWTQPANTYKLQNHTWYNVAVTSDNSNIKVYINSVLIASYAFTGFVDNTNPIMIGTRTSGTNGGFYNGKIDDIHIYNRALNASAVDSLYNEGLCYQYITVTDTLRINLGTTGFNPVTYANTIKIFPNPTNTQITIDCSNYTNLSGYTIKIINTLSSVVYSQVVSAPTYNVNLSTIGGVGTYFVQIYDNLGNLINVKTIILQ